MGHLNVQFYTAKLDAEMAHLRQMLGLTANYDLIRAHRSILSRYLSELHAGDVLDIQATFLLVSDKSIHLLAGLVNGSTGQLSATFEIHCDCCDRVNRHPRYWPDMIQRKIRGLTAKSEYTPQQPNVGSPVPACSLVIVKPYISSRGTIPAWTCDTDGQMSRQYY